MTVLSSRVRCTNYSSIHHSKMRSLTTDHMAEQSLFVVGSGVPFNGIKTTAGSLPEDAIVNAENDVVALARPYSSNSTAGSDHTGRNHVASEPMMTAIQHQRAAVSGLLTSRRQQARERCDKVSNGAIAGNRTSFSSSAVVLSCSGRKCLEPAGSRSAVNSGRTLPSRSELSPLLPIADDVKGHNNDGGTDSAIHINVQRFGAEPLSRHQSTVNGLYTSRRAMFSSQSDPLVNDLFGFRAARTCWTDDSTNDRSSSVAGSGCRRSRKRCTLSAERAETNARRHIWACQLPGTIKRSSRVAFGLSTLMANLRDVDLNQHSNRPAAFSSTLPVYHTSDGLTTGYGQSDRHRIQSSKTNAEVSTSGTESDLTMPINIASALVDGRGRSSGGHYTRWRPATSGRRSSGLTTSRRHPSLDSSSSEPPMTGSVTTSASSTSKYSDVGAVQLCITSMGPLTPRLKPRKRVAIAGYDGNHNSCRPGIRKKGVQYREPVEESKFDTETAEIDDFQSAEVN